MGFDIKLGLTLLGLTLLLGAVAAGPTTKPVEAHAPGEPGDERGALEALKARAARLGEQLNAAKTKVITRLATSMEYVAAKDAADKAEAKLNDARANGTSEEKLTASSAYTKALGAVKKLETAAFTKEGEIARFQQALREANDEIVRYEKEATESASKQLAKQRAEALQRQNSEGDEPPGGTYDRIKDESTYGCRTEVLGGGAFVHMVGMMYVFTGNGQHGPVKDLRVVVVETGSEPYSHVGDQVHLWFLASSAQRVDLPLRIRSIEFAPSGSVMEMSGEIVPVEKLKALADAQRIEGELPSGKQFVLSDRQVGYYRDVIRHALDLPGK